MSARWLTCSALTWSVIKAVLEDTFGKKPAVIESNLVCIDAGFQYCKEQGFKQNIAGFEPIPDGNKGRLSPKAIPQRRLALSTAALRSSAGIRSRLRVPWQNRWNIILPRLRKQIDGKKTYAIVQAEDEIASAGMIVGAGGPARVL